MMRFPARGYSGSVPGILHPSQVNFGVPFDYWEKLYDETFTGDFGGGYIRGSSRGIEFFPPLGINDIVVAQSVISIQPSAGVRLMMAARFLIDHTALGGTDAAFGFWSTDSDPFGSLPTDGAFFKHAVGVVDGSITGVSIEGSR